MRWVELDEKQVGGVRLKTALTGQTREGGVYHKGGGTTLDKTMLIGRCAEAGLILEGGAWRKVGGAK